MKLEIGLKEIPIFRYLDKGDTASLSAICQVIEYEKDQIIIVFGSQVPGLYIVASGEVHVFTDGHDARLASIGRGGSFGEMTLIEPGEASSANIVVASPKAELIFCRKEPFHQLLEANQSFRASFYQGASTMLSQRLRQSNEQISKQVTSANRLLASLLNNPDHLGAHLGKTRNDLMATGDNMTTHLFRLIPQLEALAASYPQCADGLSVVQKAIEQLLVVETQNFDKISQQLDLIMQHFSNINRVINGEAPVPIRGDRLLFVK